MKYVNTPRKKIDDYGKRCLNIICPYSNQIKTVRHYYTHENG